MKTKTILSFVFFISSIVMVSAFSFSVGCGEREASDVSQDLSPKINQLIPNHGEPGDIVQMNGINFGTARDEVVINFGSKVADIIDFSDKSISFIIPDIGYNGNIDLPVTLKVKGKVSNSISFSYNGSVEPPKIVLKLNTSDNNPRNSEGAFVTLEDGRIMFIYSYFYSSMEDESPAHLAARYSSDGGKTWTNESEIVVENEGDINIMSVSLLRLQNGDIALFYLRKNSLEDCMPIMRISKDEAKTWSKPISCITDREGYFILHNDRVIQLQNGRLLMPVSYHQVPGGGSKNDLYCYYSDDNGMTWNSSSKVPNNFTMYVPTHEPGVIEMKDGHIMMHTRSSEPYHLLSYSSDKGETWSELETSNIPCPPFSPASMKKIPGTNDWLLVWNRSDGLDPRAVRGDRTPLSIAISRNEGKTWEKIKNIKSQSDGFYCYTAIHFINDGKNILLGYIAGVPVYTEIALLDKKWLYSYGVTLGY